MLYDWSPELPPALDSSSLGEAICRLRDGLALVRHRDSGFVGLSASGAPMGQGSTEWELLGLLPPIYPEWLGDRTFHEAHNTRFAYVTGAMANGIASVALVEQVARVGALGFFGSAGLPPADVIDAICALKASIGHLPWGVNLINSPNEPALEAACAHEIISRGVTHVEASAYMELTPALVTCAVRGLSTSPDGQIVRPRHIFAKVSRPEVARRFLEPAPASILSHLLHTHAISEREAQLAAHLPIAQDITVEADSGGHTDNQPLVALFPVIASLRDQICAQRAYAQPIRVGAAGGIGSPHAAAAAFALGAAYIVTGSINQACVESGLSTIGKELLAQVGIGDVMMAPAADMFELGVKLQVVRRGTMFGPRAQRLYDLWRAYERWEDIPEADRDRVERTQLGAPFEQVWLDTQAFFQERDPEQLDRASHDPKHKMALVFRWYLGKSSRWANAGVPERAQDYQIWCGPSMAAFNRWVQGSLLDPPDARRVGLVALNLMEGAARLTRASQLRAAGLPVPDHAIELTPQPLAI